MGVILAELEKGVLGKLSKARIFLGPVGKWQIVVTTSTGKEVEIETRMGTPKTWRVFEDAVQTVIEFCRGVDEISVEIGPLKLVQQKEG